jgi:hypothetical protein
MPLVRYQDGSIYAMSLSQPGVTYRVTLAPELSCACQAWAYRQACCYVEAATGRFGGLPVVEPEPRRTCHNCGSQDPASGWRAGAAGGWVCQSFTECQEHAQAVRAAYGVSGRWL